MNNLNDLIPRAAARDVINTWGLNKHETARMNLLHYGLNAIVAIDAEPVRHGYIKIQIINPYDGEDCYCSMCGHWSLLPDYKWCPYCGAKMDG